MKRTLLKIVRYLVFSVVCLVTLAALILTEEKYRGKWAWEEYRQEAVARGQKLDFAAFIPPPVPDEQNFAMTPLLKPLFGKSPAYKEQLEKRLAIARAPMGQWFTGKRFDPEPWTKILGNPDLLEGLKKFDPELDEISAALRRPYSRVPIQYGPNLILAYSEPLISLSKLLELRILAALSQGRTDRAAADVETLLRLALSLKGEPLLISQIVLNGVLSNGIQPIWEGLAAHQWSEAQLGAFQGQFQQVDGIASALHSFQGERAFGSENIMTFLSSWNSLSQGWVYQNLLSNNRFFEEHVFKALDPAKHRVFPQAVKGSDWRPTYVKMAFSYSAMVKLAVPVLELEIRNCAYFQTVADEAAIACALERYWLKSGEYPEDLAALVPQYFTQLPHDVITGKPLHYHRTGDSRFILYSVGWDEDDDHGQVVLKDSHRIDRETGDWVWQPPVPTGK